MGLLSQGKPLTWSETKKYVNTIKEQGINQFIHTYHKLKDRKTPCLMWGDEIEYMLISFDEKVQKAMVLLKGEQIIKELNDILDQNDPPYLWHPEFASYMVEGTPGQPFKGTMPYFNMVESNMKARREAIKEMLLKNETVLTIPSFPRLGCKDFCDPLTLPTPVTGKMASLYIPDKAANNSHPRFLTIAENIKNRKGRKVYINLPIFQDVKTPKPFKEDFKGLAPPEVLAESLEVSLPNHVYMDAMCFGMGCCCLQVTFQACNIEEARYLYDQLGALCPIMLALTAASPMFKGYLVDRDCRWDVISACVDDRTKQELGIEPYDGPVIRKSRYDSIDCYISYMGKPYNDIPLLYEKKYYDQLVKAGVDQLLAQHIAHLFIRDPVIVYEEKIIQTPDDTDHFENIQSTNWQTMRFKPPPPNSSIGWRVEFRPQEIQLTDFENAAYVIFVVLLTRAILSFNLNFLIPISKMEENMVKAQKRDAVLDGKFWFHYRNYSKRDAVEREGDMERRESEKQLRIKQDALKNLAEIHETACKPQVAAPATIPWMAQARPVNGLTTAITNCCANRDILSPTTITDTFVAEDSLKINGFDETSNDKIPNGNVGITLTRGKNKQKLQPHERDVLNRFTTSRSCCKIDAVATTKNDAIDPSLFSPESNSYSINSECSKCCVIDENDWTFMSINEIINGNSEFPGLVPLVKNFLNNMDLDVNTRCTILKYLKLIEGRASGTLRNANDIMFETLARKLISSNYENPKTFTFLLSSDTQFGKTIGFYQFNYHHNNNNDSTKSIPNLQRPKRFKRELSLPADKTKILSPGKKDYLKLKSKDIDDLTNLSDDFDDEDDILDTNENDKDDFEEDPDLSSKSDVLNELDNFRDVGMTGKDIKSIKPCLLKIRRWKKKQRDNKIAIKKKKKKKVSSPRKNFEMPDLDFDTDGSTEDNDEENDDEDIDNILSVNKAQALIGSDNTNNNFNNSIEKITFNPSIYNNNGIGEPAKVINANTNYSTKSTITAVMINDVNKTIKSSVNGGDSDLSLMKVDVDNLREKPTGKNESSKSLISMPVPPLGMMKNVKNLVKDNRRAESLFAGSDDDGEDDETDDDNDNDDNDEDDDGTAQKNAHLQALLSFKKRDKKSVTDDRMAAMNEDLDDNEDDVFDEDDANEDMDGPEASELRDVRDIEKEEDFDDIPLEGGNSKSSHSASKRAIPTITFTKTKREIFPPPDSWVISSRARQHHHKTKRSASDDIQAIIQKADKSRKGNQENSNNDETADTGDGLDDDEDDLIDNGSIWVVPDDSITIYT